MNKKFNIFKILIALVMSFIFIPQIAQAAGSAIQVPMFYEKYNVILNGSTYMPPVNQYPFIEKDVKQIGFDTLYGTSRDIVVYKGEVPDSLKDEDNGQYRRYNNTSIDGIPRPWSYDSKLEKKDITPDSEDIHIRAMTGTDGGGFNFAGILFSISNFFNFITAQFVNLIIWLKNVDINGLAKAIDGNGHWLSNTLATLFAINPKNHQYSPFLVIMIALSIFALVASAFRAIKGQDTFKVVGTNLGMMFLSMAIASILLVPGSILNISNAGVDVISALSNDIVASSVDSASIFVYKTGNMNADVDATQRGLLTKNYIDTVLGAQFGVPIEDLDLKSDALGTPQQIEAAARTVFPNDGIDGFAVNTGSNGGVNGSSTTWNLGYYFWAANSNVYINNMVFHNPAFNSSNGTTTGVSAGTNSRVLNVIDFLNALRKEVKDDQSKVNKIDMIINHMMNPDYFGASANVFINSILNVCLAISLGIVTVFMLMGKIIVVLGAFAIVILPGLVIFEKTRPFAKKLSVTYLAGYLRYVVGATLFNAILLMASLISQQGTFGMILASIVSILIAKFAPEVIRFVNEQINMVTAGNDLDIVRGLNRIPEKIASKGVPNLYKNPENFVDENGNVTKEDPAKVKSPDGITQYQQAEDEIDNENVDLDQPIDNVDVSEENDDTNNTDSIDENDNTGAATNDTDDTMIVPDEVYDEYAADNDDIDSDAFSIDDSNVNYDADTDSDLPDGENSESSTPVEAPKGNDASAIDNNSENVSEDAKSDDANTQNVNEKANTPAETKDTNVVKDNSDAANNIDNKDSSISKDDAVKQKIKENEEKRKQAQKTNRNIKIANQIPFIGKKIADNIVNKATAEQRMKSVLLKEMQHRIADSDGAESIRDIAEKSKSALLSQVSKKDFEDISSKLDKAISSINKNDIAGLKPSGKKE